MDAETIADALDEYLVARAQEALLFQSQEARERRKQARRALIAALSDGNQNAVRVAKQATGDTE